MMFINHILTDAYSRVWKQDPQCVHGPHDVVGLKDPDRNDPGPQSAAQEFSLLHL